MNPLFETTEINGMKLSNRFVRSATWEGMAADDGSVTEQLKQTMLDLATGGVGLIITGHAYVSAEGQAGPWQLAIDREERVEGLRDMCEAVHQKGGRIVAQLAHAGHFAMASITGKTPWVASVFNGLSTKPLHEMTQEDIATLIQAFADAAGRAKAAGFDGVQMHAAHGYLLSQFLSPAFNKRTDEYGGSVENRVRLHRKILTAIRREVGPGYPILIKINSEDCIENGLTIEDSTLAARILAEAGLDAVELSGGTLSSGKLSPSRSGINKAEKEAYFRNAAAAYKKEIDLPLILVGGLRSLNVAQQMIDSRTADYISMCRPLIREPGLVRRWQEGDTTPALCKSDNLCFGPAMEGKGITCVVAANEKKQAK